MKEDNSSTVGDESAGLFGNPVDWIDSVFTVGDITVVSVEDMALKIKKKVGSSRIQNLFIGGHGSPGYQSVGAGSAHDATGARSLQVDAAGTGLKGVAGKFLTGMAPLFTQDAIVTLGGCQVGKGPALLSAVSRAFGGISVQAGTSNQRPLIPGMEGDVVRCRASTCKSLSGGSWWASPGSWIQ